MRRAAMQPATSCQRTSSTRMPSVLFFRQPPLKHQDAAILVDGAAGIDITHQRAPERVADRNNAIDALLRAFLVRLDVAGRIMTNGNVRGIPAQHRMAA